MNNAVAWSIRTSQGAVRPGGNIVSLISRGHQCGGRCCRSGFFSIFPAVWSLRISSLPKVDEIPIFLIMPVGLVCTYVVLPQGTRRSRSMRLALLMRRTMLQNRKPLSSPTASSARKTRCQSKFRFFRIGSASGGVASTRGFHCRLDHPCNKEIFFNR